METRQLVTALAACLLFFVAYQFLVNRVLPPLPATPAGGGATSGGQQSGAPSDATTGAPASQVAAAPAYSFSTAANDELVALGGGPADVLAMRVSPRGAAIVDLKLTEKLKNGKYVHRVSALKNDPVTLLSPVDDNGRRVMSFATRRIRIVELGAYEWPLDDLVWTAETAVTTQPGGAMNVSFATTLRANDGATELLRLRKKYALRPDKPLIDLSLEVESLADQKLTVVLTQDGPVGLPADDARMNPRHVFAAFRSPEGTFELPTARRDDVKSKGEHDLSPGDAKATLLWAAQTDKYFGVFLRPIVREKDGAAPIAAVRAALGAPSQTTDVGDGLFRLVSRPLELTPRSAARLDFEITAAPKDESILEKINPSYGDARGLNFVAVKQVDSSCFCSWEWLRRLMTGLINGIRAVVGNYGIAIMVLVVIVRTCLHPLAVFQQKSMFRMQESMGRIQPKMNAIKEKYANDKVKQNQEIMKLWSEENVNPMASMFAFIPMFIQMPILIALWTALNTDINLRNAPFDGWWIKDLSQPDALYTFASPGWTIPVLGWIPLIGGMFTHIQSINVLPLLMGLSMYLQQKYMPKPAMQAKLEAAKSQAGEPRKPGGGMTPEEQMRQQQMMANMMSIMFPLMFYYQPSGLALYWMATNVFGIAESLIIRRQIDREKQMRAAGITPASRPKKATMLSKFFKRIAAQAEELQKKADQMSKKP